MFKKIRNAAKAVWGVAVATYETQAHFHAAEVEAHAVTLTGVSKFREGGTVVHEKTGGRYVVIAIFARIEAEGMSSQPHVVYRSKTNGGVWVRPHHEFKEKFKAVLS